MSKILYEAKAHMDKVKQFLAEKKDPALLNSTIVVVAVCDEMKPTVIDETGGKLKLIVTRQFTRGIVRGISCAGIVSSVDIPQVELNAYNTASTTLKQKGVPTLLKVCDKVL